MNVCSDLSPTIFLGICFCASFSATVQCAEPETEKPLTNSIGMELVRIHPGSFIMGFGRPDPGTPGLLPKEMVRAKGHFPRGDFDEHPDHNVTITKPFYMGIYEVTNAQYEYFDPHHRKLRGRGNYSFNDDEPVVYVSWNNAVEFCRWLSAKEDKHYRLPTEAEWEYACRAGTAGNYHTGQTLSKEFTQRPTRKIALSDGKSRQMPILTVGLTQPNAWGLYDMHGNVEEWTSDWYGPYVEGHQIDPVGRADGDFKVTRGGSCMTDPYYMRSSNRRGTIPQDRLAATGFRVVLGELARTVPLPIPQRPLNQRNVDPQIPADLADGPDPDKPYFAGPRLYVKIPDGSTGPLFWRHNHNSSIVACPNGDLLAAWFSCMKERSLETSIAASRLRYGKKQWEPASLFWDTPDRDEPGHNLWCDGKGTIFHFNTAGCRSNPHTPGLIIRTSTDSGATWSKARPVFPKPDLWRSRGVLKSIFRTNRGRIIAAFDGFGGSYLLTSPDDGQTWSDPGGRIRGIHAGVVQLADGRLMALARTGAINGKMPRSISCDMGKTFTYTPSEFQPLNLGQLLVLRRLNEGPLFLASFCRNMPIVDVSNKKRPISGLFAAVSFDQGQTWPHRRLISHDGPATWVQTMDGHPVIMDAHESEYVGYMSACQAANGVIHLLTSRQHYSFNLKWLTTPPPAATPRAAPVARKLPAKRNLPGIYETKQLRTPDTHTTIRRTDEESLRITTGKFPCSWRTDQLFTKIDPKNGFTAEIRTRIIKNHPGTCGAELELYDGFGSRYAMTITDTGVYWYEGLMKGSGTLDFAQHTPVNKGLDNTSETHVYRIAVRPDRIAQIYRDGQLLGLRRYEYRTPRDAYIRFGAGSRTEAIIDYVRFDLSGPYEPAGAANKMKPGHAAGGVNQ